MSTDWKALCAELAYEVEQYARDRDDLIPECVDRALAALAAEADGPAVPEGREPASVVGEPSDAELLELMPETMRDEFSYAAEVCADATGNQVKPGIFRVCLNTAALEYARAALSRYGHQPALPAEGEQRHPTPVPVTERLPGPEDCDALGYCWWWDPFRRESWEYCITGGGPDWYWLPATALPLPQGEVQP